MTTYTSASSLRRLGLRLALLSTTIIVVAAPVAAQAQSAAGSPAQAQAGQVRFNVPAQELDSALTNVADQGSIRIFFTSAELAGVRSNGVSGAMTVEQALSQVLTGTGFSWRYQQDRTVVIERVPQSQGAIQLGPVRVEGDDSGSGTGGKVPTTGDIVNLPQPYAGGQVATGARIGVLGNRRVFDTPFNVTGYTESLIRDQQARDITDVLINNPSVRASLDSRYGINSAVTIRGFDLFNDYSWDGLYGLINNRRQGLSSIERVEIITGPSAFLNGVSSGQSIAGAVNFVPKRAEATPRLQFATDYSSDAYFGGRFDVGRRFGQSEEFGVRLNGSFAGGDTPVDNNHMRNADVAAAFDYKADGFRWTVDLVHSQQRVRSPVRGLGVAAGVPIPDAPDSTINPQQPWEYFKNTSTFFATRVEADLTEGTMLFAAFGAARQTDEGVTPIGRIINAAGDTTSTIPSSHTGTGSSNYAAEAGLRTKLLTGSLNHNITLAASGLLIDSYLGSYFTGQFPTSPDYSPALV